MRWHAVDRDSRLMNPMSMGDKFLKFLFLKELGAGTPELRSGRRSEVCRLFWCVAPAHQIAER